MVESAPAAEVDTADIDRFLDALWMERVLSRNTLAAYRRDLTGFARWLDEQRQRSLLEAQREDLLGYLAERVAEQAMPRTTARLLSSLRRFYQLAVRDGELSEDPSDRIEAPRLGRSLPKALTEDDVELLINAPNVDLALGLRDRAMLELLYATGLRVSELVGCECYSSTSDRGWYGHWARAVKNGWCHWAKWRVSGWNLICAQHALSC